MSRANLLRFFLLCTSAFLLTSSGCKGKRQAEVQGVWIAQADGLSVAPQGATIAVSKDDIELSQMPDSSVVRLAIARDVQWSQVRGLRRQIQNAGKTPVFLVASRRDVGGIELWDELIDTPIDVRVGLDGKLCVSPPGHPEAKCVQRGDKRHVDRAFTRELVREAVKVYKLKDILVDIPPELEWADVVRAIDGARTCCYETKVRVRLK